MDSIPQKQCTRCKNFFPQSTEYFYKASNNKTCGLKAYCKSCGKIDTQKWREENYEEYRAYNKEFIKQHPEYAKEQIRASQAKAYASDPELFRFKARLNYHKHVDKSRQYQRDYRKRKPEVFRKSRKKSYEKNADSIRLYSREWAKNNPLKRRANEAKRRANARNAGGRYTDGDILRIYADQNGKCKYCGKSLTDFHVDHIRPLSKGGSNYPDNLAVSCPKCNLSKNDLLLQEWEAVRGW